MVIAFYILGSRFGHQFILYDTSCLQSTVSSFTFIFGLCSFVLLFFCSSKLASYCFLHSWLLILVTLFPDPSGSVLISYKAWIWSASLFHYLKMYICIFAFCQPDSIFPIPSSLQAPLLLTHVCHYWRSVALGAPGTYPSAVTKYKNESAIS